MNTQKSIGGSWQPFLGPELKKGYMGDLRKFLKTEYSAGKTIYPTKSSYFAAFQATDLDDVKVVIIGQDPYHGPRQAHGLCFSVMPEIPPPPSLVNIYKELQSDLGVERAHHGYLKSWADQGVLLLNSVLTVEEGKAASHRKKGWEQFTDRVIEVLNERERPMVFMLWGAYAQKKADFVNEDHHLILKAPHPSPLSAHRGFLGCGHFSKANAFLIKNKWAPVDWELPKDV